MQQTIDFQKDVIKASKKQPILVDFWAEWCGPCKVLGPVLEKLETEANNTWRLVKINTDLNPELSRQYQIQGIPAVKLFVDGQVAAEFTGALPEPHVKAWLDENLPTESKKMLEQAKQLLTNGEIPKAHALLEKSVEMDGANLEAKRMLAMLVFDTDIDRAARLASEVFAENPGDLQAQAIQTLQRILKDKDEIAKSAKRGGHPKAWQAYLAGIEAAAGKDYDTAITKWIEALIIDRSIDDDGPRRACVAVFNLLGQHHELTQKHHRSFSSALF